MFAVAALRVEEELVDRVASEPRRRQGVLEAAVAKVIEHGSHELSHGTPFRTGWLNTFFFQLTSFLALHETVFWRWSHARHHTDTIIVGNDREIAFPRPVKLAGLLADFFFLKSGSIELARTVRHAFGSVSAATCSVVLALALK